MRFTPVGVRLVRDIPEPYKDDMRSILDNILAAPDCNPFQRSMLNAEYYVPRLQQVVDLLVEYQSDMHRYPRIGEKK